MTQITGKRVPITRFFGYPKSRFQNLCLSSNMENIIRGSKGSEKFLSWRRRMSTSLTTLKSGDSNRHHFWSDLSGLTVGPIERMSELQVFVYEEDKGIKREGGSALGWNPVPLPKPNKSVYLRKSTRFSLVCNIFLWSERHPSSIGGWISKIYCTVVYSKTQMPKIDGFYQFF